MEWIFNNVWISAYIQIACVDESFFGSFSGHVRFIAAITELLNFTMELCRMIGEENQYKIGGKI